MSRLQGSVLHVLQLARARAATTTTTTTAARTRALGHERLCSMTTITVGPRCAVAALSFDPQGRHYARTPTHSTAAIRRSSHTGVTAAAAVTAATRHPAAAAATDDEGGAGTPGCANDQRSLLAGAKDTNPSSAATFQLYHASLSATGSQLAVHAIQSITVNAARARTHVVWADGHHSTFPHAWLRDHCRCTDCLGESTLQRKFDTASITGPSAVHCTGATILHGTPSKVVAGAKGTGADTGAVKLDMAIVDASGDVQEHSVYYPLGWLRAHCSANNVSNAHGHRASATTTTKHRWTSTSLAEHCAATNTANNPDLPGHHLQGVPFVKYRTLECASNDPIRHMLDVYGVAFISGVPLVPRVTPDTSTAATATSDATATSAATDATGTDWSDPAVHATEALVRDYIGFPRETFWGYIWDTASDGSSGDADAPPDTAFTTEGLNPHVDCTYLRDPPQLQVFLCETPADAGQGGESTFLDTSCAAAGLRRTHPEVSHLTPPQLDLCSFFLSIIACCTFW